MIPLQKIKDIILRHSELEKDMSSGKVDPKLFPTSTAPGLIPKVLFFPGPINKVSVLPLETIVWN